ncbi:DUF222 domain-containing protein [Promicromonospora sp. NPDC052451]|uniref:HNH endonuclease signature motif containing protein n=1 Tax=Promicromonospora sp. NPDC052451 TaxID=3364407 RepID=UPI0037C80B79
MVTNEEPDRRAPGVDARTRAMEDVLTDLEALAGELVDVAGPDAVRGTGRFCGGGDIVASRLADAAPRLRTLNTRLETVRLTWLPVIEQDHPWQSTGARTFATWLARTENVTTTTARREVRTARTLRDHLPTAREQALAGRLGADHVRALVDVAPTSEARKNALAAPVEAPDADTDGAPPRPSRDAQPVEERGPTEGTEPTGETEPTGAAQPTAGTPPDGGSDLDADRPGRAPAVPTGEEYLTGLAGTCDPGRYRRMLKRFAVVADPDADERGYKRATEREHLEISPTFDGWHVSGFLTDEHGQQVSTALGSMMGAPTPGDSRTPTQRRAQALADLARDVLDHGRTGTGAAVRPHVSVTVSLSELMRLTRNGADAAGTDPARTADTGAGRGTGTPTASPTGAPTGTPADTQASAADPTAAPRTDPQGLRPDDLTALTAQPAIFTGVSSTGNVVPDGLLRKILCDAAVTRVVFGPDSAAVDVGRSRRTVSGQLRRAVIARDQHCVYPGCDQPAARCEVHHAVTHWADGGSTSLANSALLCWHHHTLVDTTGITMDWRPGSTPDQPGHWRFTSRLGRRIDLPHARAG